MQVPRRLGEVIRLQSKEGGTVLRERGGADTYYVPLPRNSAKPDVVYPWFSFQKLAISVTMKELRNIC